MKTSNALLPVLLPDMYRTVPNKNLSVKNTRQTTAEKLTLLLPDPASVLRILSELSVGVRNRVLLERNVLNKKSKKRYYSELKMMHNFVFNDTPVCPHTRRQKLICRLLITNFPVENSCTVGWNRSSPTE
jgi:hypothetical protein